MPPATDLESGQAWNHLLDTLKRAGEVVLSDSVPHDPVDMASGFRHLLVLLGVGIDELLRRGLDRVPAIKPSGMDAAYKWGMECPDCIYMGSSLEGGSTYRLWGNRGSARYVGLQVMAGMGSTANALIDDFELGPDGEFEIILSAEPHEGNWLPLDEDATMLVVRHFFYDWEHEVPVTMSIEPLSASSAGDGHTAVEPQAAMARQVIALGRLRGGEPQFLPGLLESRGAQHLPPTVRRLGHGSGCREPSGHRIVEAGPR